MPLPQRNLLMRGLYGLAMISMFVFLVWQSWLPLSHAGGYDAANTMAAVPSPGLNPTTASRNIETRIKPNVSSSQGVTRFEAFQVSGLTRTIDLSSNPRRQMERQWQALADSPLAANIDYREAVYAIYQNYDSSNNSVMLTLGVRKLLDVGQRVSVVAADYESHQQRSVLEVWQRTGNNFQRYSYQTDFERWTLDQNFKPLSLTAFVGLNAGSQQ